MARHLGKIIKIIKAEKQPDTFDPEYDKEYETPLTEKQKSWNNIHDVYDLRSFVGRYGNLDENQFIDLMTFKKPNIHIGLFLADALKNWGKEHDNPQVMQKIINSLNENKDQSIQERNELFLNKIASYGNVPEKYINERIDAGDEKILNNPNIKKNHLYRMAEKHPEHVDSMIHNKHFDDKLAEKFFGNSDSLKKIQSSTIHGFIRNKAKGYKQYSADHSPNEDQSLDINPRIIHSILEHAPNKISKSSMDIILDHADPTFKKQWVDKALGITDGKYVNENPDDYEEGIDDPDFKSNNWDNWEENNFAPEFNNARKNLASSRHLDDEQAEHIKRHGDFEQKYDLYHNKHIDPKHGAEMFQKWHDDDSHHGYNSEDLNEKYKEDKQDIFTKDDLDESVIDDIRQEAYDRGIDYDHAKESYPFHEWVSDNEDKVLAEIGSYYDNIDEVRNKLREEYDDWTYENPNSSQNEGNPIFDALNKLHESFKDEHINLDELKETTGISDWSQLDLKPDDDNEVHTNDIVSKLDEFGGPLQIDYTNHDSFSIQDHPDFDERYESVAQDWRRERLSDRPYDFYEDFSDMYRESDEYNRAAQEAVDNYVDENIDEHIGDLYDNAHQDYRFIPNHLHAHIPNYNELESKANTSKNDSGVSPFLDTRIKNREYEHSYGEDQHFYEMVKDHADANGGSIDIGTMTKLYPNQKEKWQKVFNGKGKISTDEVTQNLQALPKTKYNISYGKWDKQKMQNVNSKDQIIFRLDHSSDSLKPLMEDPGLYDTFKNVQKVSKQSGHPTKDNTIAWARVDASDPKHWMIDEVQSDFGKTVARYLKDQGAEENASYIDKISAHHKNWRESLTNAVLKEAKKHGAEKVSTHSPESKAKHTGANTIHSVYKDSYQKVPRQMGFKPTPAENLPLNDQGKEHFNLNDEDSSNNLQGHTFNLTPSLLKKRINITIDLIKKEKSFVVELGSGILNKDKLIEIKKIREYLCC